MPGPLSHVGASTICPHAGQVTAITSNTRVMVSGQPVALVSDTYTIAGCAFTLPNGKPQPCVKALWLQPALRVKVNGQPVILQTSSGLCQSAEQIPQGPPTIVATQPRVIGQ
ncbi:MAG: hypothetical protein QNJ22_23495 [Desulfosarcinaceae bacterium]|nr:hypothetical protein [Desulfosarcinaceae bacterium]